MKELLKNFLDKYAYAIAPYSLIIIGVLCFYLFFDLIKDEIKKPDLDEPGIIINQSVTKISTKNSRNFISCIYEQLECYNKNAGLSRKVIIDACKDIDYCDKEGKK